MKTGSQTNAVRPVALLCSRRFAPLFLTQFLGAVNDNVFKASLLVYLAQRAAAELDIGGGQLVTIAGGLFILPFLLFSSLAGQLADARERSSITRLIKLWEIVLMGVAAWCFYLPVTTGSTAGLLVLIFLMGTQSSFFGPIKYSLIPEHLNSQDVLTGNALVGSSTFVAILTGTIAGSLLASPEHAPWLGGSLMGLALCGWAASLLIPQARIANPGGRIKLNPFTETVGLITHTRSQRYVWRCILGISWFWTVGAIFLTQLPHYSASHLGQGEATTTMFLAVLLVGIGLGALSCPLILKRGTGTAVLIPCTIVMAAAVGLFSVQSLWWEPGACAQAAAGAPFALFCLPAQATALLLCLLTVACAAGIFVVPLYVSVQFHSDRRYLSRTIATNNVLNALFMVVSSLAGIALYALGITVIGLLLVTAVFVLAYLFFLPGSAGE